MDMVESVANQMSLAPAAENRGTAAQAMEGFAETLKGALQEVNRTQLKSEVLGQALALGQVEHLHDVMIAAQEATIALQTAIQVRNRVVEAYQEIMRMQI